ncbi:MAG: phosphotransferase [Fimbriimonadaceae bacterium]|nr:phosphotransferase [Fimbriimonadaceae bacterium]
MPDLVLEPPARPVTLPEHPTTLATRIIARFELPAPVEVFDFEAKGNINQHTFLVRAGRPAQEYLLQRINQEVFVRPRSVMAAMSACLAAQRRGLAAGLLPAGRDWTPISLVPTRDGQEYAWVADRRGETCWRLMHKIPDAETYKSLGELADPPRRLAVAAEAGRGLALFGDLVSDLETSGLANPLPGYRETRVYYQQLHSVLEGVRTPDAAERWLPADEIVRSSTARHFQVHCSEAEYWRRLQDPELQRYLALAVAEEEFALTLLRGLESGTLRRVAIHGDTKLDNFLFDPVSGQVKALVDLDTILPHSWLADWGDMVRSLCNVAGEKETDLERVRPDWEVYQALASGFRSTARRVLPAEVELMPEAVEILALELGVRFLTDYLRGDSYFALGPADPPALNKTRALVQLTLFERLRDGREQARRYLEVA